MPSIVGTWKMVGATARHRDGKPLPAPYGGKGMGRVAFTAEGRMMAVTCDARPELPPGTSRTYSSLRPLKIYLISNSCPEHLGATYVLTGDLIKPRPAILRDLVRPLGRCF
jgi:hypothetical protein